MTRPSIHPTAIVDPKAELAADVSIGPWTIVGAGVEIAEGCRIASHVCIEGPARIGQNNRIFPFASVGAEPQDKKFAGEKESELIIGDGNTIRESVTINRGTRLGGGRTVVGDDNWIMAYVHIAHDCSVGNHTVLANMVALAGHVVVGDHAVLSGDVGVHQFCRVGSHSFAASRSVIARDVPPFMLVEGNRAKPCGLNREGLRRNGFSAEQVAQISQAYRSLYREGRSLEDAMTSLAAQAEESEVVAQLLDFLRVSRGGIVR